MELTKAQLSEYDFRVLIDGSGSMAEKSADGSQTRWNEAAAIAKGIADFAGQVDDDGIDVLIFGGQFLEARDVYPNTTADKVYELFGSRNPAGSTPLAEAVQHSIAMHFAKGGKKSFNVVITDGIPNDKAAVVNAIVSASNKIDDDSDLTFLFLQVGDDGGATKFLTQLDDDLQAQGAKFDIVDKLTVAERGAMTFEELFYHAQND
jgi:Mg-chelatase subunit ChlD